MPGWEDKMARIADVVKLRTGYANFVNLKNAYEEARENTDRAVSGSSATSGRRGNEFAFDLGEVEH